MHMHENTSNYGIGGYMSETCMNQRQNHEQGEVQLKSKMGERKGYIHASNPVTIIRGIDSPSFCLSFREHN